MVESSFTLLETFASYLPRLVTRHLVANPVLPVEPLAEHFPAAVLIADLCGFTPLAERLARRGADGAEELTRLLNAYFGQLIDLILTHGGDVVDFEGDALTALWPVEPEKIGGLAANARAPRFTQCALAALTQPAILQAAQCALAIQEHLHPDSVEAEIKLALRIGIGAGEIAALHVGGVFGRWKLLLNGAPLIQAGRAKRQAEPGQVILSPEAWQVVSHHCLGQKETHCAEKVRLEAITTPAPLLAYQAPVLNPTSEAALRAYLPAAIRSRLAQAHDRHTWRHPEWLAELRRVTMLFINLPNFNESIGLEQAQAIAGALQKTLYHYEGSFNKMSVSDEGATLVAAFGLPPLAHEDDPVRALQAALAAQVELQRLGVRSAMGITTGRIFCGAVGNAVRREYTMIGDPVNLAARLMQNAAAHLRQQTFGPEQASLILCDAATHEAAHQRIAFDTLLPIKVKGKTETVTIYQPLAEQPSPAQAAQALRLKEPMVGRQAERALLSHQLQRLLRGGPGGILIIEGEAGIGKSRLLEDLKQQAAALPLTVFSLSGQAIEKTTPYQAWRPLFSRLLDLDVLNDPDARRQHILSILESSLDQDLRGLAPLLNVVLPLELPDSELTAPLTGQRRADRTHSLLLKFLSVSVQQSPKVILVDDAQWLDLPSWALTLAIAQHIQPLLLVVALRPFRGGPFAESETPPVEYSQLRQLLGAQSLRLEMLSTEETLALVCQRLGLASVPASVAALILEKAEGNPFFSEELAYALRETGLITIEAEECRLAHGAESLSSLRFPDTLEGVITSRIDRLHPQQQLVLKIASVVGREFSVSVLEKIHPMGSDLPRLREHLHTLERLGLIERVPLALEPTYSFQHAITQEVVYNLMLFAQRREIHGSVGLAVEALFPQRVTELHGLLATHFFRGEVWEQAVDYAVKAGESAVRLNAQFEACQYFDLALESLAHLPYSYAHRRLYIDLALQRISLAWGSDLPQNSLKALINLEALAKALPALDGTAGGGDPVRLARIHFWMGRIHFYCSAPREALACFQRALIELPAATNEELLILLYSAIAETLLAQGHFGQAQPLLEAAVTSLETSASIYEWIQAAGYLAISLAASGNYARGLEFGQRALARAEAVQDQVSLAAGAVNLCLVYLFSHQTGEALGLARRAVGAAEQSGNQLYRYLSHSLLGWAEGLLGNFAAAEEQARLALATSQNFGGRLLDDWSAAMEAEVARRANRNAQALQLAQRAVTLAQRADNFYAAGFARRTLAQALVALNARPDDEAISRHFAESIRYFEAGGALAEAAHTRAAWKDLLEAV